MSGNARGFFHDNFPPIVREFRGAIKAVSLPWAKTSEFWLYKEKSRVLVNVEQFWANKLLRISRNTNGRTNERCFRDKTHRSPPSSFGRSLIEQEILSKPSVTLNWHRHGNKESRHRLFLGGLAFQRFSAIFRSNFENFPRGQYSSRVDLWRFANNWAWKAEGLNYWCEKRTRKLLIVGERSNLFIWTSLSRCARFLFFDEGYFCGEASDWRSSDLVNFAARGFTEMCCWDLGFSDEWGSSSEQFR